uniref:Uncharacterized protein n=1 Tax=Yoonia rhodophyticola TaxID=3137370 RepID=A0AAN0MDX1_9RHOB
MWLVYFVFGMVTRYEIPIWATALLVIIVDRTVTFITTSAADKRSRLRE